MKYFFRIMPAVLALLVCMPAGAQKKPSRKQLEAENARMALVVDSLTHCIDSVRSRVDTVYVEVEVEPTPDANGLSFTDYSLEEIDRNIDIWKLQMQLSDFKMIPDEMEELHPNATDEEYLARLQKMNLYISVPYNGMVRDYMVRYGEKYKKQMSRIFGLCYYYMPIFEAALDRYGLPLELKALAILESNLNPKAVSPVGAKGLWQFMYSSAKAYGLQVNSFVDERFDPYKSSDAAARYLRDAYKAFGDWPLAICSYNCGYGGVRKAIQRAGGKTGYWDIYPFLPRETRNYVPALVGVLYSMYYREELGIEAAMCPLPTDVDTLEIGGKLHLKQVSETLGADLETLRKLNPQYVHDIIPDDGKAHALLLPDEYTLAFIDQQDSIAVYRAAEYLDPKVLRNYSLYGGAEIVHKVKSGENLSVIAAKYGVTVAKLKSWNHLTSTVIKPGQKLLIYK